MNFLRLSLSIILIIILSGCVNQSTMQTKQIKINDQLLKVEVAETIGEMTMGLSGRTGLPENGGMIFKYPNYQSRNFHMKDMNFPLDFIWIKDDQIIGLTENVAVLSSDGGINKVKSPDNVNQVLEVNAGWISQNNVKIGESVQILD